MSLEKTLTALGLADSQVRVYLTVLQHGKISPSDVARITGMNRATVYKAAGELAKRRFIRQQQGRTMYLVARPLDDLEELIEQERAAYHKKEHLLRAAMTQLQPLANKAQYSLPHLSFIDEERFESYIYGRLEAWAEALKATDGVWRGFQDHSFAEFYESHINWAWKQPYFKDLKLQLFTNDSAVEKRLSQSKKYPKREIQFWPHSEISASTWILGDSIVLVQTRHRPHYLFEIHDPLFAKNQRDTHRVMWERRQ